MVFYSNFTASFSDIKFICEFCRHFILIFTFNSKKTNFLLFLYKFYLISNIKIYTILCASTRTFHEVPVCAHYSNWLYSSRSRYWLCSARRISRQIRVFQYLRLNIFRSRLQHGAFSLMKQYHQLSDHDNTG